MGGICGINLILLVVLSFLQRTVRSQFKSSPCEAVRSTKFLHHPLLQQFSHQEGKAERKVSFGVSQNLSGDTCKAMRTPMSQY